MPCMNLSLIPEYATATSAASNSLFATQNKDDMLALAQMTQTVSKAPNDAIPEMAFTLRSNVQVNDTAHEFKTIQAESS